MLVWQISRVGMLWIFAAVLVAVAPLTLHLPLWVPVVPLAGLIWRVGIYRGLFGAPGRFVKVSLVALALGGLGFTFNRLYGLEPMCAMLVCALGLKLLEIRHRRDALVVIYLAYFLAATFPLFDQTVVAGGLLLMAFTVITAGLVGLHQTRSTGAFFRPLAKSLVILMQALPLMIIFFLVMPRLGPLWSVPSPKTAVTGMSDHLAIGDITQLGKSSRTAFRVTFEGDVPAREELYWRGLTLSRFDGRTWRPVSWGYKEGAVKWYGKDATWWLNSIKTGGEPVAYDVVLERQNGLWLFGLLGSEPLSPGTGVSRMQTLLSMYPLGQRFQYRARFWPEVNFEAQTLPGVRKEIELALPEGFNPQTVELARRWSSEAKSVEELIERLFDRFNAQFFYTLQPPPLGEDAIDDFLFRSKAGFCEHFASSFVFFMRAAGYPARLVVGYQGGEIHPDGYVTVRQYDAHAWAEVWIENRGWVRFDPTAAVAPERIIQGLIGMMTAPVVFSETAVSLDKYREIPWINQVRLYLDSIDYAWGKWVLGYQHVQTGLMQKLLGKIDYQRVLIFLVIGSLLALAPAMIYALWPWGRPDRNRFDRYYLDFCSKLARKGCVRGVGESPRAYASRCEELYPARARSIQVITSYYEKSRYSTASTTSAEFRKMVRQFDV